MARCMRAAEAHHNTIQCLASPYHKHDRVDGIDSDGSNDNSKNSKVTETIILSNGTTLSLIRKIYRGYLFITFLV